ncbi:virulence factor Mce-like protein [Mycobacterium sp. OAS707]|uniref:MlaD family protein n=1 Tax=Mycobacterium sp. OAS707 TaxID=2663822 RepID=UPI001789E3C5|nr:MlaD family protein [Mycobacterium sp. OAS707]MBE1549585.1 virulence factor Mce-like protein [Mycobacterium sp. OAS707]
MRNVGRSAALLIAAVAVVLVVSSWTPFRQQQYIDYCATMPDAVGLFTGNPVTQMGYQIGEVRAITPSLSAVRVDFKVVSDRPLPADVRAVTRSPSILADRALELVGNYSSGPQLRSGECIPAARSATPKSLSEIIGSATSFLNQINPNDSTNVGDVVNGLDRALHNNGPAINQLLTTSSSVLDSPDQAVSDMRSIITNLVTLTSTLREISGPLKATMLATLKTTPDVEKALATPVFEGVIPLVTLASDMEVELGDQIQTVLNDLEYAVRKASAHSTIIADLLKPFPVIINKLENWVNRKQFNIRYRPPLYRISTPVDGLITCGAMNAASPGSCTDVGGKPYAVDVALLQYVLTLAARR